MYKKFFCIALFLIMIASMTCISASEDLSIGNDALANVNEIDVESSPIDDTSEDLSGNGEDVLTAESSANNGKLNPNLDANVETDNEYVTITSTVNENATGNITLQVVKLNDESFELNNSTIEIERGTAIWAEMIAFNKGDYLVSINYLGDDNYKPASMYKVFAITKTIPDFNIKIDMEDEFVTVTGIVNQDATGNVTLRIKTFIEENYTEIGTIELENGTATLADKMPFNKGEYVAYTTYSGDKKYFKSSNTQIFTIEKEIPDFNVNITVNDYLITLNTTLPANATGTITIRIKALDEENYTEYATIEVENGTAIWSDFVPFNKGNYEAYTTYSGDENYFRSRNIQTFAIEKEIPDFNVNLTVNDYIITLNTTLPANATGTITIRIKTFDEENYTEFATLEVENGTAVWSNQIPFSKGNYVAFTTYSGDENYFKMDNTQTFAIEKDIADFDINITTNDYFIIINATLPTNATGTITIKIKALDEENYTEYALIKVENGTAIWNDYVPFDKGTYITLATYNGDENYFKNEVTETFTIEKRIPVLLIDTTINGTNITITVTPPKNATGILSFINDQTGEIKNVTLNGTSIEFNASLQFASNIFRVKYYGDEQYFAIENLVSELFKIETSLSTTGTVSVTYQNTAKITVKLSISDEFAYFTEGGKVTITVNNKKFSGTLKNNTATISIAASNANAFIAKKYTATVTFDGDEFVKNSSTSFTLNVKKGTPKLTANGKSFKVSTKTKKYTLTLKDNKNKVMKNTKVTLKVNGKTFKATTNSKGKATFKITNLKKRAKYIALIKYSGSKYYNAVSKKIKITVK